MKIKTAYLAFCYGFTMLVAAAALLTPYYYDFTVNMTQSLPGTLYVIHKGEGVGRGALVAYRWTGGATYPAGTTFIKRVVGMPGDEVKAVGRAFWVNGQYVGLAKERSRAGVPLTPAPGGLIPPGAYFVATPSPDSLDSRYALSGNIQNAQLIGRAYAIF